MSYGRRGTSSDREIGSSTIRGRVTDKTILIRRWLATAKRRVVLINRLTRGGLDPIQSPVGRRRYRVAARNGELVSSLACSEKIKPSYVKL